MRTIFAEYNPQRNSIDVYTSAGYMLRFPAVNAEHIASTGIYINAVSVWIVFCIYRSHRIKSPYRSINHFLKK